MTRYGLIGCGMMGQEHLRNIALLPGAEVTALFDPRPEMLAQAARLAPGATACDSLTSVLDTGVDAVVIASPNDCHVPDLRAVMAHRPVPVLLEKPAYVDEAQAALLGDTPAPVWVAMEYRYMPPIAAMIQEADAATGGIQMLAIREHRFPFLPKIGDWNATDARTGGTLVEKCCHFFDLMRCILGDDPIRIQASGGQAVNRLGESDVWDHAFVLVDFAKGARAMLDLCMFAEGSDWQEELAATGPTGKIEAKVPGPTRFWPDRLGPPPVPQLITSPRHPKAPQTRDVPVDPALLEAGDHNGATFYQHEKFLDVVRGHAHPEVTLTDGIWAARMGRAAQEAARTGQAQSF